MYEALVGKQRSLVFPIMCNAFVKLDYSDNIPDTDSDSDTATDIAYGLWGHEGSFTFEAIVTPYEINGNGAHQGVTNLSSTKLGLGGERLDNKKVMPNVNASSHTVAHEPALIYLSRANRIGHEMMIFNNDNFKISLLNSTTHTQNNPAQYKIKVAITIGTTTKTVTSDVVISPSLGHTFKYNSTNGADLFSGFDSNGRVKYAKVAEVATGGHSAGSATITTTANNIIPPNVSQELYIRDGFNFTSLGTVGNVSSTTTTLSTAYSSGLADGTALFLPTYRHASYIDQQFHIGCVFDNSNKTINIYLNGILIKTDKHGGDVLVENFSFAKVDTYIGSNGLNDMTVSGINDALNSGTATGPSAATTCKQFMGEFHELSLISKVSTLRATDNLLPNYNDTLLYLRFEEVDL